MRAGVRAGKPDGRGRAPGPLLPSRLLAGESAGHHRRPAGVPGYGAGGGPRPLTRGTAKFPLVAHGYRGTRDPETAAKDLGNTSLGRAAQVRAARRNGVL